MVLFSSKTGNRNEIVIFSYGKTASVKDFGNRPQGLCSSCYEAGGMVESWELTPTAAELFFIDVSCSFPQICMFWFSGM